jgi:FkbM family methyltransferase
MGLKQLLHDLCPPLLWRLIRPAPSTPAVLQHATVERVRSGPLQGLSLLVNAAQPAFREMIEGSYDSYLWDPLPKAMDGGMVLDVGAHIGYHSLGFAALFPQAKVVAFEPNPANLERLQANLDLNTKQAEQVTVFPAALSDVEGTLTFRSSANVEDQTSSGGYLERGSPPLDEGVYERAGFQRSEVPTYPLDRLVQEKGWTNIRVIKIDVEGAEHLVLTGALETLERDRPILLMEIHSVVCMLQCLELLHPLGYSASLLHEDRPGRCFIVAR